MTNVKIVTESSSTLPPDLAREYDIRTASLGYVFNNKTYRDNVDITLEEFYKQFPELKSLDPEPSRISPNQFPTTSAAGIGDFRNIFLDLTKQTQEIICLTMTKLISATYKAAEQAAQLVMEEKPGVNIQVIDSKTGSAAMGMIALEAAKAAKAGKSPDEVLQVVRNMMPRTKYFMILESLKYIMKIGRNPDVKDPAAKAPAAIPPISPIMGIVKADSGVLETLERGSNIDEALAKSIEMVKNYIDVGKPVHFLLSTPDRPDKYQEIRDTLTRKYNCAGIIQGRLTPSMLVSCGPTYFLGFYS